ncbi:hypothetical protein [Burkholderia plantarii]|uniref:hypothetical protein n=1 Tax=Burkholderia plantarii TaxID=41899 RepID=UPI001F5BA412|nr:hypothetical protein [Burkholderia plantarii]
MLTRCALFSGRVRPGFEARFAEHVKTRLVPLWTRLPGAREVRVPRQQHSDAGEPAFALDSPVRRESQIESRALIEMFDGVAFHTVFAETVSSRSCRCPGADDGQPGAGGGRCGPAAPPLPPAGIGIAGPVRPPVAALPRPARPAITSARHETKRNGCAARAASLS